MIPLFYLIILKRVLGENFSQEENPTSTEPIILDREALPLGSLSYLHVGTSSRGYGLKPWMVLGHGWVEHGSYTQKPSHRNLLRFGHRWNLSYKKYQTHYLYKSMHY